MTSMPASAPTSPASAQPSVSIRPTRTPSSRATSGANAAARMRSPVGVQVSSAASASISPSTEQTVKMSWLENSAVLPTA